MGGCKLGKEILSDTEVASTPSWCKCGDCTEDQEVQCPSATAGPSRKRPLSTTPATPKPSKRTKKEIPVSQFSTIADYAKAGPSSEPTSSFINEPNAFPEDAKDVGCTDEHPSGVFVHPGGAYGDIAEKWHPFRVDESSSRFRGPLGEGTPVRPPSAQHIHESCGDYSKRRDWDCPRRPSDHSVVIGEHSSRFFNLEQIKDLIDKSNTVVFYPISINRLLSEDLSERYVESSLRQSFDGDIHPLGLYRLMHKCAFLDEPMIEDDSRGEIDTCTQSDNLVNTIASNLRSSCPSDSEESEHSWM
ncbi:hypothetical protein AAG570_011917 [Ranatra chinensis]|uniref:Uncharacterized protein n=1 Tax=Ranatra chinensis TaxID=642074 RepID=A0ABD0YHH8_9HEMI